MAIEIVGIRPALLDPDERARIDELRAFRHVFRHMYQGRLEVEKLQLGDRRTPQALAAFQRAHERFLPLLDSLIQAVASSRSVPPGEK